MCGICGINWKQAGTADETTIRRVNRSMVHRGPDDEGYHSDGNTQLAMRRLSIIDLAGGHQPITTDDGRYTIVFNGEIYNYLGIRDDLIGRGHVFHTHSDTETILHAYTEWGADSVHRLRGMFAYAIRDRERDEIFLVRDRLGIKPLYYAETGAWFAWASEIKALLAMPGIPRDIDYAALHAQLVLYAYPTPASPFRAIRQIPPGHRAWYRNGELRVERYWDVPFDVNPRMTEQEAIDGIEEHLRESVRLRLLSEVPLGAFLSGGIDSSLVVAMMARQMDTPVRTFSIGWSDRYADFNEVAHARAVAERYGTEHHEHTVTTDDLLAELPRIVWSYDQPTPSAFQTYFVSKFTRSQGITVALSGLGGDEIAAGYNFFAEYSRRERMWRPFELAPAAARKMLARLLATRPGIAGKIGRAFATAGMTTGERYSRHRMLDGIDGILAGLYTPEVAARALTFDVPGFVARHIDSAPADSWINRLIYHELRRFMLDDPLSDTDRCSMAHSLEVRVPLIDHALVEFAGTIPPALKLRGSEPKYLLKRLAERYLPEQVIYRRKMGFEFPMVHWMHGPLKPLFDAVLDPEVVSARGLFRSEAIADLRRAAEVNPSRGSAGLLWNLVVIELWCRLNVDRDDVSCPDMELADLLDAHPQVSLR